MVFTWALIYFFVFRGTKSIGKVVYVTAIFPYFMLFALLIRSCTLKGSISGIEYFLGITEKVTGQSLEWFYIIFISDHLIPYRDLVQSYLNPG